MLIKEYVNLSHLEEELTSSHLYAVISHTDEINIYIYVVNKMWPITRTTGLFNTKQDENKAVG